MAKLLFSPPVLAHRGACGYAPENTLAAFIQTIQLNIDWIEFDVMLDCDGLPIIFHDELLDRISNSKGLVCNHPYNILKTYDTGSWFHHRYTGEAMLTLKMVCDFLSDMQLNANVELKSFKGKEVLLVKKVCEVMKPYFPIFKSHILFSSFCPETLFFLRKTLPDCNIGLLVHDWFKDWDKIASDLKCVSIHVNQEIITPALVDKVKKMNKQILCYTVNDMHRAKELFSWGVEAIFSDYPDRMCEIDMV